MASAYVSDFPAPIQLGQITIDCGTLTADGSATALTQGFNMNAVLHAWAIEDDTANKTLIVSVSGQSVTFDGMTASQAYHVLVIGY